MYHKTFSLGAFEYQIVLNICGPFGNDFPLKQGSMSSNSSAKLVDCILALKSYHDWKEGGALGFWRLKSPSHPTGNINKPVSKFSRSKSMNNSSNARKKWTIPDPESLDDASLASLSNQPPTFEPDSSVSGHETLPNGASGEKTSSVGDGEDVASNETSSAGTTTLVLFFLLLSIVGDPVSINAYLILFSCVLYRQLLLCSLSQFCSVQIYLATTPWRQIP